MRIKTICNKGEQLYSLHNIQLFNKDSRNMANEVHIKGREILTPKLAFCVELG